MASRGIMSCSITGLAMVLLVAMLWARATAQSGCSSVIIGLAPCLNYVTGSSSSPSASCCSQLANVVGSQPRCLCTVLNGGGASLGVTINQTLALALPAACKVQTPPVSKCNSGGSPTGSPEGMPSNSVTGGSKATSDTSTNGSNGITTMGLTLKLVVFATVVASAFSSF